MKVSARLILTIVASACLLFVVRAATMAQLAPTAGSSGGTNNQPAAQSAPAGFDNQTNGFSNQKAFDTAKDVFAEVETTADGIGPLFNATSCADCHNSPVVGGSSQVTEVRAASYDGSQYHDHPGGSLINDRSLDSSIREHVYEGYNVRALRSSVSVLGDGFIEAIEDSTLEEIAKNQPGNMRGTIIKVPILEANGAMRVGRFGWKNQHASLESFAADAYLNEMGITSPLQATENSSNGDSIAKYDTVADPEDDGEDVRSFAEFMRSTKAPPREETLAQTADAKAGSSLFTSIGCETCHVRRIVTAPTGTKINGGAFVVPPALGNKVINPFGDFLLHDIATGDGIVQNGGSGTMNKVRTAHLWGLRTRSRLMHDGNAVSPSEAITRHKGEASGTVNQFNRLSDNERRQLLIFLDSL